MRAAPLVNHILMILYWRRFRIPMEIFHEHFQLSTIKFYGDSFHLLPWVTLLTSKGRDNTFLCHAISQCSRLLETIVEQRNESDKKHCRVVNCLSLEFVLESNKVRAQMARWKTIWNVGNIILQYHTHLLHSLRAAELYETISKWCFTNAELL